MAESGAQLSYIKATARPWLRIFTFQHGFHLLVGSILIQSLHKASLYAVSSSLGTEILSLERLILCLERKAVRLVKLFLGTVAFSTTKQQTANSIVLLKKSNNGEPHAWILGRSVSSGLSGEIALVCTQMTCSGDLPYLLKKSSLIFMFKHRITESTKGHVPNQNICHSGQITFAAKIFNDMNCLCYKKQ